MAVVIITSAEPDPVDWWCKVRTVVLPGRTSPPVMPSKVRFDRQAGHSSPLEHQARRTWWRRHGAFAVKAALN